MSLFCRINKSKLQYFTLLAFRASQAIYRTTNVSNNSIASLHGIHPNAFCINSRFFAAPVQFQVQRRKEEENTSETRLNENISTPFIRLVTDEGHSVVSRDEALRRAKSLKLDLVEVDRLAKPPVCKIFDYNKEKYVRARALKERESARRKTSIRKGDCKEVRFTGKIEGKDLKTKADGVIKLMERGYRVKCMAVGKEDEDLGALLSKFIPLVEGTAIVESGPHVGRLQAYIVVRHVKFGHPKKSSKIRKAAETTDSAVQNATELSEKTNSCEGSDFIQSGPCSEESPAAVPGDDFDGAFELTETSGDEYEDEDEVDALESSFSSIDSVASQTMQPRSDMVQPLTREASAETVNRYKKSEPRNRLPPQRSLGNNNAATRDTCRVNNQFFYDKSQSVAEPRTGQNNPSHHKNLRVTPFDMPGQDMKVSPPNIPRQDGDSHVSPVDISRQSSPRPGSSGRSFGIFSADINQQGAKGNINDTNSRYPTGDSRFGGPSAAQKSTSLNSDHSKGQTTDRGGQAGFGIFSRAPKP